MQRAPLEFFSGLCDTTFSRFFPNLNSLPRCSAETTAFYKDSWPFSVCFRHDLTSKKQFFQKIFEIFIAIFGFLRFSVKETFPESWG